MPREDDRYDSIKSPLGFIIGLPFALLALLVSLLGLIVLIVVFVDIELHMPMSVCNCICSICMGVDKGICMGVDKGTNSCYEVVHLVETFI
ncbi:hypothetical protein P3L10_027617 [Capsicum annuum]